jgi:hypothetical protein
LLNVGPDRFKIDSLRSIRAIYAPQPTFALALPKKKDADRVLFDQRGQRFHSTHDCQAPRPVAFLTNIYVTVENATLVEIIWSDGRDCSNDWNYGARLFHRSAWKSRPAGSVNCLLAGARLSQYFRRVCGVGAAGWRETSQGFSSQSAAGESSLYSVLGCASGAAQLSLHCFRSG